LNGKNTWSNGTQSKGGTMERNSVSAFGLGDVHVSGGKLASNAPEVLTISGKYTQLANVHWN